MLDLPTTSRQTTRHVNVGLVYVHVVVDIMVCTRNYKCDYRF